MQKFLQHFGRICGWLALIFYVSWNVFWLYKGHLAPSIVKYYFGIPSPSTGMTRSLIALGELDGRAFFLWNPMTLPLLAIFVLTLGIITFQWLRKMPLRISPWLFRIWIGILLTAWMIKLLQYPEWI